MPKRFLRRCRPQPPRTTCTKVMWRFVCFASLLLQVGLFAAEPRAKTVEEIADKARNSVVVITQRARDGSVEGVGSGFVVSRNGLIATSLHVIGEGRPIEIRFADGKKYSATEVHAWDRKLDLAIIRIGES